MLIISISDMASIVSILKRVKRCVLTKRGKTIVNKFAYTMDCNSAIFVFENMTEEWLQFVVDCCKGIEHSFDIMKKPMVDDQI